MLQHVAEVGDHVLEHADDESAGNGSARARYATDQRAREAVEQDAGHHVGLKEHDRCDEHAGHRADGRRETPTERQHPIDIDADEARRIGVERRSPHGKPERREAEEAEQ